MIVCSCNMITAKDIHEAVSALRTKDPFVVLTPGLIYKTLGKRPVWKLPATDHQVDGGLRSGRAELRRVLPTPVAVR